MESFTRRALEALGNAGVVFLTGLAVYKGFSEVTRDALFQPMIQAGLTFLAALGFQRITRGPEDSAGK